MCKGTADAAPEAPKEATVFVEDLSAADVAAAVAAAKADAYAKAEGMIAALQLERIAAQPRSHAHLHAKPSMYVWSCEC